MKNDLQKLNERGGNNSREIVDLYKERIAPIESQFGDSLWAIYEQLVVAALDCGDPQTAKDSVLKLRKRFPDSRRVRRLICLYHEFSGKWDLAEKLYNDLVERDAADSVSRKRQICILRARPVSSTTDSSDTSASFKGEAKYASNSSIITELVKYLELFQNDQDAWGLLCDLYLIEGSHEQAAFCMEELVLCNPYNSVFFLKFGEILYSQASQKLLYLQQSGRSEKKNSELVEVLQNSRAYYAHALRLDPNSTRALFGFFLVASTLCDIFSGSFSQSQQSTAQFQTATSSKQSSSEQLYAENAKYVEFARERLFVHYAAKCPGLKQTVARALAQLQTPTPASLLTPLASASPSSRTISSSTSNSSSNNLYGSSSGVQNGNLPSSSGSSSTAAAAEVSSSSRDRNSVDSNANAVADTSKSVADASTSLNTSGADTSSSTGAGKAGRGGGKKDKRKPHKS